MYERRGDEMHVGEAERFGVGAPLVCAVGCAVRAWCSHTCRQAKMRRTHWHEMTVGKHRTAGNTEVSHEHGQRT